MILRYLSLAWFTKLGYGEFSWLRLIFVFTGHCFWLTRKCKKSLMALKRREMLTNALRALVNNPFKESFNGKRKKAINFLTTFSISHKSGVKTFLKLIVNKCFKGTR